MKHRAWTSAARCTERLFGGRRPLADRLWEKVEIRNPDECWPWLGARDSGGYGMIADETWTNRKAHRLVLALSGTEVGDADVCHTCDNPACCNPAHLFLGTHLDNMRDRQRKGRTVVPPPRSGESNPRAKLTEHDVDEVRWAYAANRPIRDIAADFGVSRGTVRLIVRRETWRSVP